MEDTECGPASMAMILAYFGRPVPLEQLRQDCRVSARDGCNAADIIKAAQKYGLVAQGFHMGCEQVKKQEFPVLIHWKFNHFIVLEGYGPQGFYLRDSSVGAFTEDEDSFYRYFTGIVLTFKKTDRFREEARQEASLITWRRYLQKSYPFFAWLALLTVFLALGELAVWLLAVHFIEEVFRNSTPLLPVLAGVLLAAVLSGVLAWVAGYLKQLSTRQKSSALTKEVFQHLLSLPLSFFASRATAGSRTGAAEALVRTLYGEVYALISDALFVLAYAVLMFLFSPPLAGLVLLVLAGNLLFTWLTLNKRYDLLKKGAVEYGIYQTAVSGLISTLEILKSMGCEDGAFARYARHQAKAANDRQAIEQQSTVIAVVNQLAESLGFVALLGLVGWAALQEKMTPGVFIVFYASLSGLFARRTPFKETLINMKRLKNFKEQVDDILKHPPDQTLAAAGAGGESGDRLTGEIRIESLCFGYDPDGPPLIKDFSLSLKPGASAAIVGVSGSGKSTLLKIIARLHKEWAGDIFFDGLPQVSRDKFIRSVALVEQDTALFAGSIRENLTLWDPAVSEEDILHAVKDACLQEEVAARGGLDAPVEPGGVNFSGGERQRLEIARALVKNPAVLLLDEATAALDTLTEKKILDNIKRRGCTVILAAHRLSAVRDCDTIIELGRGQIPDPEKER